LSVADGPRFGSQTPNIAPSPLAMRIRLQSLPPLPVLKAWFVLPDPSLVAAGHPTINNLKGILCREVPILSLGTVQCHHILLEMDGFELLDGSLWDVIREGDLITHEFKYLAVGIG
jgi:hypothetical protein